MADSRSSMLTPAFVPIAGGWFTMGTQLGHEDERPPHPVFVDRFELGVCPVTRAEYERFVEVTRHELDRRGRVLRVAIRARRARGPVADRSRVGIRRARAARGALPVG